MNATSSAYTQGFGRDVAEKKAGRFPERPGVVSDQP
jgi:hypothetical protein